MNKSNKKYKEKRQYLLMKYKKFLNARDRHANNSTATMYWNYYMYRLCHKVFPKVTSSTIGAVIFCEELMYEVLMERSGKHLLKLRKQGKDRLSKEEINYLHSTHGIPKDISREYFNDVKGFNE